ncbi:spinocerebellar ataxia type 10 protein domain-containing protein [Earliella scabrosa]|nr:spinocerebellar ataxia type 10 protein domain-containing protein [Earliella scabrosa]
MSAQTPDASCNTEACIRRIQAAADAFDPAVPGQSSVLVSVLDESATLLAGSEHVRKNIGNATNPSIWPLLHRLWARTLSAHMLPNVQTHPSPELPAELKVLSTSLAKFTRNLVAAVPSNQREAFRSEPCIRNLVYHYTSFAAIQDPFSYPVTRMLVQALSNMVTANDSLASELWSNYLSLPDEHNILIRLFASPDARTLSSAFVLVLNCTHNSAARTELLVEGPGGPRTCLALLDRMASLFDAEESTEEGRAFDIGYEAMGRVIESGIVGRLYTKLSVEGEAIAPHQTTLLKLLDSYLHTSDYADAVALLSRQPSAGHGSLCDWLTWNFLAMSTYVQSSLRRTLGSQGPFSPDQLGSKPLNGEREAIPMSEAATATMSMNTPRASSQADGTPPLLELDLLLAKVCEALVLVTQCLTTIALRAEEAAESLPTSASTNVVTASAASPSPRAIMVEAATTTGQGLVECLIDTLRLIDAFVPRITYGKVFQRPTAPVPPENQGQMYPNANPSRSTSPSEAQNDRGQTTPPARERDQEEGPQNGQVRAAAQAFAHVKRDLVRLLGILASHDRGVQDRVRECGGIPVVMNLCVVDDYNPYLREHAIFALRNLLDRNLENQAVVDAVKPVGRWDENKVLQELQGSGGQE